MIASGWEREEIPAIQAQRLTLLLSSLRIGNDSKVKVIVCDDFSHNVEAQEDCREVCERFGVAYYVKPPPWKGPCGNYNYAVSLCESEIIAMLGDDQWCMRDWFDYMRYFIENNKELPWGMLGWCVVFAEDLVKTGFLKRKEDFYDRAFSLRMINFPSLVSLGGRNWCSWGRPTLRAACSGTAFVIKKSLWERFGGFYEEIYQFDEDYGDNVWMTTELMCIQVPTPPLIHYGGACDWPPLHGASHDKWRRGWETRPLVPISFENRGKEAKKKIDGLPKGIIRNLKYLPMV
jgi:hypothetical protein